jgi:hypothetical protein
MTMERNPQGSLPKDLCEVEGSDGHEIERATALLQEATGRLARRYPEDAVRREATEDLRRMKPCLYEALATLEEIEGRRELTLEESSRRRAFRMLLEGT